MSYKKFFVSITIFSLFSFSVPQISQAQWVDVANTPKEYGLDFAASVAQKIVLKKLTAQTVNWINSGFKGNPAFISDPQQFFLETADGIASTYLSDTALNQLCAPFKAKVRIALVKNYLREGDNYSCTLRTLKNNYNAFMNDFDQGGWDGWFEVTQTSGGNPFSAYFIAENQLLKRITKDKEEKEKELDRGSGFLSYKKCKEGTTGNDGKCTPENMETVTPGSVINDSLSNALGSGWKQLEAADELNEVVSALVVQLMSTLLDKGLSSLSKSSDGRSAYTTQIIEEPAPEPQYTDGPMELSGTTMNCVSDGSGGQTCTITPGTVTGPDYLSKVNVQKNSLTGGKCIASSDNYADTLMGAIYDAVNAYPELASLPPTWDNSMNFLSKVEEFAPSGYNITTKVLNGNNNPNRGDLLAIWRNGDTLAERYDVIGSAGSTSGTIEDKIYKGSGEAIPVACATGGSANCKCATSPATITPPAPTTNPEISSINPITIKTGQILTINGKNLTTTVQLFDATGTSYTYTGQGGDTKVTLALPVELKLGFYTVKIKSTTTLSNSKSFEIIGTAGPAGVEATPGWRGALAHNPNTNNWLVVSGDTDGIYGRIMSNAGGTVSSVFKISGQSTAQVLTPKVSYSPDTQKFLVVWHDTASGFGGNIYGKFITPTGIPEDLFSVAQDSSSSTVFNPNGILRYDSVNKKFVLVWEGSRINLTDSVNDVYLRTIDSNKTFGTIIKVTDGGGVRRWSPAVDVKTDGSEYCVAYDTKDIGGVRIKKVDALLGTVGTETLVTNTMASGVGIVYNSVNNKYLVTWQELENLVVKVKGKILNSCDGTDGGQIFTIKSDLSTVTSAYNPVSNRYAIIGQNQNDFANGYVILGSGGNIIELGDLFGSGTITKGNFAPIIAPNLNDGTFSQTSSRDYIMTRFLTNFGK